MQAVKAIIAKHGGLKYLRDHPLKIENPPYLPLCVEWVGGERIGQIGGSLVSVAHYVEQNGDQCANPDLVMFVSDDPLRPWEPWEITQHLMGVYNRVEWDKDGRCLTPGLLADLRDFARMFSRNIQEQGFIDCI